RDLGLRSRRRPEHARCVRQVAAAEDRHRRAAADSHHQGRRLLPARGGRGVRRLPIRVRLTLGYLAVLAVATLTLAGGAWWLFDRSMTQAADASLAERVDGTRRFIDATAHELPPEELSDEFGEF